jgi:hypothetical protein
MIYLSGLYLYTDCLGIRRFEESITLCPVIMLLLAGGIKVEE